MGGKVFEKRVKELSGTHLSPFRLEKIVVELADEEEEAARRRSRSAHVRCRSTSEACPPGSGFVLGSVRRHRRRRCRERGAGRGVRARAGSYALPHLQPRSATVLRPSRAPPGASVILGGCGGEGK